MIMAENHTLDLALRAMQLLFAFIIMGTDGYAIHEFQGHTELVRSPFGDFYAYSGVPNAWGFLIFCASWTVLTVVFNFVARSRFANRAWTGYICVAIEAIATLSWLAGFVAVSVTVPSAGCAAGKGSCGSLIATTVFGAFEWLLFVVTAAKTGILVFNSSRLIRSPANRTSAAV